MVRFFVSIFIGTIFFSFLDSGNLSSEEKKSGEIKNQLNKEKAELQTIQKKIEDKKIRIEETKQKEEKVLSELNRIEEELSQKKQDFKQYEINLKNQEKESNELAKEIEHLQAEISEQQNHLADRIKALYKLGRLDLAKALFSADSFPALIRRYGYTARIIDYNLMVINDYSQKLVLIQDQHQRFKENEKKLKDLTEKTRSLQENILTHQKEKTNLLAKVKTEKDLQLRALEELKQASSRLQSLIDSLEKGRPTTSASLSPNSFKGDPFSLKGRLSFPVEGRVVTFFGEHEDPEFSIVSFNKGIEIVAQLGSPIKAVLDGTVIYSGWFKGYGNIIIIDHGSGFYTLSGHASELYKKVGEPVSAGEPIGLVGDTGSLKGPNLYFEIRHHGQPLDPLGWLKRN